jgi:hypothetical protein
MVPHPRSDRIFDAGDLRLDLGRLTGDVGSLAESRFRPVTAGGRPGRLGLDRAACRPAIRSRCQRSTVSGRTSSRSRCSTSGLRPCSTPPRSLGQGRRTTPPSHPTGVPARRSDAAAPRFRRPCPDRSPEEGAAPRTCSSPSSTPVATTRPFQNDQPLAPLPEPDDHPLTCMKGFGKHNGPLRRTDPLDS